MKAPTRIVLASNNAKKVLELQRLLGSLGIELVSQSALGIVEVEETGLSFIENAIQKARHAAAGSGLPALADDSGLEVDALQGAPGIYSARYAGSPCDDDRNNHLLLERLEGVPMNQRTARFQCVLAYVRHEKDPVPLISQGSWEGFIQESIQGEGGFGYDPLFWVEDTGCTAAELSPEHKSRISHRGKAINKLVQALRELYG